MSGATCTIVTSVQLVDNGSLQLSITRSSYFRYWTYCSKPIVKDGEIVAAPVLALSLSFDHRQIDGNWSKCYESYQTLIK